MTITQPLLAAITQRFRDTTKPKLNQSQMAEHLGLSKAWASKLMAGKISNLTDEQGKKLEQFLGIKLRPHMQEDGDPISPLAVQLSSRMQDNEPLCKVVASLIEFAERAERQQIKAGPPWIPTPDMTRLGQEIIKIAFANEDKPGKVARMVLELLA